MSIVDALAKAKRLAQRRAQEQLTQADRVSRTAKYQPEALSLSETPFDSRDTVAFATIPYDPAICARNRIIVPEAEAYFANGVPSYRMLRTRMLHRCRANAWSTLALTSPGQNEGKSVTALNLAISIAREGNHDVFLLDLDMRNPSICQYLGIEPIASVGDFFCGTALARDVLFTMGIDRLTLGGSPVAVGNASELLATDRLENLIRYIKRAATRPLIICDLPPVVNTDDVLVIAPRIDATVLVVSEGHTRRDGLQRALDLLSDFTLGGVIVNQSVESMGSDYYGSYSKP